MACERWRIDHPAHGLKDSPQLDNPVGKPGATLPSRYCRDEAVEVFGGLHLGKYEPAQRRRHHGGDVLGAARNREKRPAHQRINAFKRMAGSRSDIGRAVPRSLLSIVRHHVLQIQHLASQAGPTALVRSRSW
jgi:hypothetical protein